MKRLTIIFISFILFSCNHNFAQVKENSIFEYKGIFLGYNTLIVNHNFQLFAELDYYSSPYLSFSIEPNVESMHCLGVERTFFSGSPLVNINVLNSVKLFPNYGITFKLYSGLCYSFKNVFSEYSDASSVIYFKYGGGINFNISESFRIIGLVMNMKKTRSDDIPIHIGVGFAIKIL